MYIQAVDKISESFNEKEIREIIKKEAEAKNFKISAYIYMDEIIAKAREYYNSSKDYWKSWFYTNPAIKYSELCVKWALESMKCKLNDVDKNSAEYELYYKLENHSDPEYNFENLNDYYDKIFNEDDRIVQIMDMLSTEKMVEHCTGSDEDFHTLREMILKFHEMMPEFNKISMLLELKNCILNLKNYCDADGIKSVLKSANKNDINVLIDFNEEDKAIFLYRVEYFIKRLKLMTSYIEQVAQKRDSNMKTIGEKYWIHSTGSDLHYNGQHALFLINKKTGAKEKVYKPHDLSADNAVVGKNGVFSSINDFFKTRGALQSTVIANEDAFVNMSIDTETHMEEFVIKKDKMTQNEAKKYFFRAGILKVITDAMAIIDLHGDNIMPVLKNMPLIIDAEIDFFQYTNSGLEETALRNDIHTGRILNSSFMVEGEDKRSGDLFKDKNSTYYNEYKNGFNFMVNQMYENQNNFANFYVEQLKKVGKVRILPFDTKELVGVLQAAIELGTLDYISEYLLEEIEKILCTSSREDISGKFVFRKKNGLKVHICNNKLKDAINDTLKNGTIIALYVDMNGKIYLDNFEIGKIVTLQGSFDVNKYIIIDVMRRSFLDLINQFYNKMITDELNS